MGQRKSLVETLIAAGVKRNYGVVGDSLNGILEEIRRSKKIGWTGMRHEESTLCPGSFIVPPPI